MTAKRSALTQSRQLAYRYARLAGDVNALASGNPTKIGKHLVNKVVGRKLVSRLWLR